MKNSLRLAFINSIKTDDDLDELWQNCFAGADNLAHMNAFVPFPLTQKKPAKRIFKKSQRKL
jgi:hypothetical protein